MLGPATPEHDVIAVARKLPIVVSIPAVNPVTVVSSTLNAVTIAQNSVISSCSTWLSNEELLTPVRHAVL